MNLFDTLAVHKRLFWSWLPFSGMLLGGGRIPRQDTEMIILRVAYLCECEYELQHHTRIARRFRLDDVWQQKICSYPDYSGLTHRQEALLQAVDEMVLSRTISDDTWAELAVYLDKKQCVEFAMLVSQYEALATTIATLRIQTDFA
ncbi:carboxymuconolactone decarboxylase family protein [Candidatus Saccharibacteria bacterium]|nr:carboxymuconolactone decarboxylase family protein [Candidatus Saccharibacteria bacterium]